MIYLDNAATTWPKPPSVIKAVNKAVTDYGGNAGRSGHILSRRAAEAIYSVREKICELLSAQAPEQVVFTYNATYALNLAIKSIITEKCHVIISDVEHNAVVRPLKALADRFGVEWSCFDSSLPPELAIPSLIRPDTRVLISTLSSNVIGRRIDLYSLSRVAKRFGLELIIDASQAVGHRRIEHEGVDYYALCAPGHKALFGISGCGFAVFGKGVRKNTLVEGGSGNMSRSRDMPMLLPEGYEAGTLSTSAIFSLGAGIDFVRGIGLFAIEERLENLTEKFIEILTDFDKIELYSGEDGIISFNAKDYSPSLIAELLDGCGVCVRAGLHCAPDAHRLTGTLDRGSVRLSLSVLNSYRDADRFYSALKEISIFK